MRWVAFALMAAVCGCAQTPSNGLPDWGPMTPAQRELNAQIDRENMAMAARRDALARASPSQRREASLLEDALAGRPDYVQALRRAAEANISESEPVVRQSAAAREARIRAEEARLSDLIETRRKAQLAQRQQQDRYARDQAAVAACQARGAQIDAAMYNPRSILNLDGAAAGAQAREACLDAYRRTGIGP